MTHTELSTNKLVLQSENLQEDNLMEEEQDGIWEEQREAERLLPAWFVPRMMFDEWFFGLLLTNGDILAIETIRKVHQDAMGNLWIDVTAHEYESRCLWQGSNDRPWRKKIVGAPTERTFMSVNVSNIITAFELAYT